MSSVPEHSSAPAGNEPPKNDPPETNGEHSKENQHFENQQPDHQRPDKEPASVTTGIAAAKKKRSGRTKGAKNRGTGFEGESMAPIVSLAVSICCADGV